jgi:hypothetical protein
VRRCRRGHSCPQARVAVRAGPSVTRESQGSGSNTKRRRVGAAVEGQAARRIGASARRLEVQRGSSVRRRRAARPKLMLTNQSRPRPRQEGSVLPRGLGQLHPIGVAHACALAGCAVHVWRRHRVGVGGCASPGRPRQRGGRRARAHARAALPRAHARPYLLSDERNTPPAAGGAAGLRWPAAAPAGGHGINGTGDPAIALNVRRRVAGKGTVAACVRFQMQPNWLCSILVRGASKDKS